MVDARPRLEPGPDLPITVGPRHGRVTVRDGSTILAETTRALELREPSYPAAAAICDHVASYPDRAAITAES